MPILSPAAIANAVAGFFKAWTSDGANPSNVNSHGGALSLPGAALNAADVIATGTVQTPALFTTPQTSGALTTVAFVSGTGRALTPWDGDVNLYVPWTTDGANNVATLKVELSPDNSTYSTLTTLSVAAALNNLGALTLLQHLYVPAGWFVKLTAVHCTIGTATGTGVPD